VAAAGEFNPDVAADIILFTVETNTHKFMAAPRSTPVERFEDDLVAMGDQVPARGRATADERLTDGVPPLGGAERPVAYAHPSRG
jgi:hypothetical protein